MVGELRIWCIRYVKAPPPKLSTELKQELAQLESQVRSLGLRERRLVHQVRMQQRADSASQEFDRRLRERLHDAERTGSVPENELAELLEQSESVLNNYIQILRENPSPENIQAVLGQMVVPMTLGGDASTGKSGDAREAVGDAAERLLQTAQRDFDRVPNVGNFDRLLSRMQMAQMLGKRDRAISRPADFRPQETTHTIGPGDTLSGLAKHFYGKESYWPYIYIENFVNLDPNRLQVGMTIRIP
jgi:hypothetical protein